MVRGRFVRGSLARWLMALLVYLVPSSLAPSAPADDIDVAGWAE
jgi:hypothetical protein